MNKKNIGITLAVLVLTLAFAAMASAYGNRGFARVYDQLTPEKQQAVQDIFEKHSDKMEALQGDMWAKQLELNALTDTGTATKADIKSLISEITDLRSKMQQERDAMSKEIEAETGIAFRGGYGMGRGYGMGGGYGMMGGNGFGDCPGYGSGNGYGMGHGYGMGRAY